LVLKQNGHYFDRQVIRHQKTMTCDKNCQVNRSVIFMFVCEYCSFDAQSTGCTGKTITAVQAWNNSTNLSFFTVLPFDTASLELRPLVLRIS